MGALWAILVSSVPGRAFGSAESAFHEADRLVAAGQTGAALTVLDRVAKQNAGLRNVRSPEGDAGILHRQATCRARLGHYRKALELERLALSIVLGVGDRTLIDGSVQAIADILSYQGDYLAAKRLLAKLLPRHGSAITKPAQAQAALSMTTVVGSMGHFGEQKRFLDGALRYLEKGSDLGGLVWALALMASYHQSLGEFEQGLGWMERAMARARSSDVDLVPLLIIKCGLLTSVGRLEEALAAGQRALELARQAGIPKQIAAGLGALGAGLFSIGDVTGAERSFREALEINQRIGADDETAHQFYNLARVAMAQRDPQRALALLEGSLALQEACGQEIAGALSLSADGEARTMRREFGLALTAHHRALAVYERLGERSGMAIENAFIATNLAELGRTREAIATARKADRLVIDPDVTWRAHFASGVALHKARRLDEAKVALVRAVDVLESVRAGVHARELRTSFGSLEERSRVYECLVTVLLDAGAMEQAFQVAERFRARSLKEILSEKWKSTGPVTLDQLRAALGPDRSLVEFFGTRDELVAFVVNPGSMRVVRLPISEARLRDLVTVFRLDLAQVADVSDSGRVLHREILAPLQAALPPGRWTIVPHGCLHYVPFAALREESGRYLAERATISYAPSAEGFVTARQARTSGGGFTLVFANPDLDDPSLDLPHAEQEGDQVVRSASQTRLFKRKAATRRRFLVEVPRASRILLSCHADLDVYRPMESALRLAPDGGDDGRVRVADLMGMSLRANLAVLSACQTGLGRMLRGDELVGLSRAFQGAGVQTVVASLWSVADASTAELVARFFGELGSRPADEALRQAQLQLIRSKRWAHPFHWAAFTLSGRPD
ncbi:MAG: CHAT domain-containing protein [Candidatus Riflebacteria bacterium]|nr:CHAT domain-containing protein [Candidatus Riflebacteria bacterium]